MKTAAAYIRVSTGDQAELSPESQLAEILRYAVPHGYDIPDEYIFRDIGISGRTAAKRPAFNDMISRARERPPPFSAVLLWKFSRFARNQEESLVYRNLLRRDGVDVVSVTEPVSDGPFGTLIESIIAWMDEYYSIRLSGEVKRSMLLNAEKGKLQTAPPFGYRVEGGKLVRDEAEAPIVLEVFQRFTAGEGKITLARSLAARGVVNRRGHGIDNRMISYILGNPAYIGKIRYTPGGRPSRGESPDTIIRDGEHDAIIPVELWEAAQDRKKELKSRWAKSGKPVPSLKDWLSGLVTCSRCGKRLAKNADFFQCRGYSAGKCQTSQSVKVKALHEAFMRQLAADMDGGCFEYELPRADISAIRSLQSALEALDRRLRRHKEAYAAGIDTLDEYRSNKDSVESEREEIERKILEAKEAGDPERISAAIKKRIKALIGELSGGTGQAETGEKNEAIRAICAKIIWDKPTRTLSIVYRDLD